MVRLQLITQAGLYSLVSASPTVVPLEKGHTLTQRTTLQVDGCSTNEQATIMNHFNLFTHYIQDAYNWLISPQFDPTLSA